MKNAYTFDQFAGNMMTDDIEIHLFLYQMVAWTAYQDIVVITNL